MVAYCNRRLGHAKVTEALVIADQRRRTDAFEPAGILRAELDRQVEGYLSFMRIYG